MIRSVAASIALIVALAIGLMLALVALVIYAYTYEPSFRVAVYDGFEASLTVDGDRVLSIEANFDVPLSPQIFVKTDFAGPVYLGDMPEDWLKELAKQEAWFSRQVDRKTKYYAGAPIISLFEAERGRLTYASFGAHEPSIKISSSPEGPFVSPPIPTEQFLQVFGKPKKWRKAKHGRGGGMP